jgi:hypothetical protein
MSGRLVWCTRWEQLNNWASPQNLVPKCANHNKLAHLALGVRKLSHASEHVHAKILQNFESVQMLNWMVEVITKAISHEQPKNTFTKINIFDVHAKFALKWQLLIGINTLTWAPNTTRDMITSPIWHILKHYNHLQIVWLMCLYMRQFPWRKVC